MLISSLKLTDREGVEEIIIPCLTQKVKINLNEMSKNGADDDLFNHLLRTMARRLIMAKRLHTCEVKSKVAERWKISLIKLT